MYSQFLLGQVHDFVETEVFIVLVWGLKIKKNIRQKNLNACGHSFTGRVVKILTANISWFTLSCYKGRGKEKIPTLI